MMEQTNQMKWIKELKENERILGRYLVTNVVMVLLTMVLTI